MASPPMTYYGFSTSTDVGDILNAEVAYVEEPIDFDAPVSLTSRRPRTMASGYIREDGFINSQLIMRLTRKADLDNLIYAVLGGWTVPSVQRAMSLRDEQGTWSPFLGYIGKPQITFPTGGYWRTQVTFPLSRLQLQSVTKTANYTVTADDRLIYCNTAGGSITLALPAVATVNPWVMYGAVKLSASNSMILDPNGAEVINSASTLTKTALNARVDFYTNAVAWFVKEPD